MSGRPRRSPPDARRASRARSRIPYLEKRRRLPLGLGRQEAEPRHVVGKAALGKHHARAVHGVRLPRLARPRDVQDSRELLGWNAQGQGRGRRALRVRNRRQDERLRLGAERLTRRRRHERDGPRENVAHRLDERSAGALADPLVRRAREDQAPRIEHRPARVLPFGHQRRHDLTEPRLRGGRAQRFGVARLPARDVEQLRRRFRNALIRRDDAGEAALIPDPELERRPIGAHRGLDRVGHARPDPRLDGRVRPPADRHDDRDREQGSRPAREAEAPADDLHSRGDSIFDRGTAETFTPAQSGGKGAGRQAQLR